MEESQLLSQVYIPTKLQVVANDIKEGKNRSVTVRTLLSWFKAERRGRWVVQEIQNALASLALTTKPSFRFQYIDDVVFFLKDTPEAKSDQGSQDAEAVVPYTSTAELDDEQDVGEAIDANVTELRTVGGPAVDPTYRIGRLVSANTIPVSVSSGAPISAAITHLLVNQFSQLPVIDGRNIRGQITWRSIASRLALGPGPTVVRDCLERCESISSEASLFAAIDPILTDGCIVVTDSSRNICGLVTTYDLSVQFNQLGEPFLLIGEVENHLRLLIGNKFTKADLLAAKDPADPKRKIEDVSDLTFGECLHLIENPVSWEKLSLSIDRATLTSYLRLIRDIRNDVMHFDPDGIAPGELDRLRKIALFFQELTRLRRKSS